MKSLLHKCLLLTFLITGTLLSTACLAKQYKVPGPAAISVAKQHGYIFKQSRGDENLFKYRYRECMFMGIHWQVSPKRSCKIYGFAVPKGKTAKCSNLRRGWKIQDVRLKGDFVWRRRPVNTSKPLFSAISDNGTPRMKPISIDWIMLEGPDGPNNKWQEAFSHCSDSSYRP
ncbi:MAG: hypothetical protein ABW092_21265 [Candidatus Thiodiazotropha sp.]